MGNKVINIEKFDELKVDKRRRHDLPIPRLPSRLCTAIIFSHHGRSKPVIKMLIVLSKSSRAFIIT